MIPPTSIDGTDITGATIDGTDVQEITVDGDTVFTAETLPVAYSNMVAWYPFDSATYGGSNTDDVTALFNPGQSGDSTPHNLTVNQNAPTHLAGGGTKDINAGANSGGFDFSPNESLQVTNLGPSFSAISMVGWVNLDVTNVSNTGIFDFGNTTLGATIDGSVFELKIFDGSSQTINVRNNNQNEWVLLAVCGDTNGGTSKMYAESENDSSFSKVSTTNGDLQNFANGDIGINLRGSNLDGQIDDFRLYDKQISDAEFNQIYANTKP